MNLLEERYRHVLRFLPGWYRVRREDEMVDAFLEGAGAVDDADNPKPRLSEIASVAALAVRVRLGGAGAAPRPFAWGETVRLAALLGLLFQAALSCLAVVGTLRLYGVFGTPLVDRELAFGAPGSAARLSWLAWTLVAAAWVASYVAVVRGHHRTAKILALLAVAPGACSMIRHLIAWVRAPATGSSSGAWDLASFELLTGLLVAVPVLALLAGFHRDAPQVTHQKRWLGALLLGRQPRSSPRPARSWSSASCWSR